MSLYLLLLSLYPSPNLTQESFSLGDSASESVTGVWSREKKTSTLSHMLNKQLMAQRGSWMGLMSRLWQCDPDLVSRLSLSCLQKQTDNNNHQQRFSLITVVTFMVSILKTDPSKIPCVRSLCVCVCVFVYVRYLSQSVSLSPPNLLYFSSSPYLFQVL